jgi:methionyl-tRNA formyltransferase
VNVAIVAEEAAGARALGLVRARGHRVTRVHARAQGTAAAAAARLGLPVDDPAAVADDALAEQLAEEDTDLLLNVHGLRILAPAVLAAPRLGAFNLHPGPLPHYAGLNTPSWAILNGEPAHGVTLHRMVPEVDAGPIAYAVRYDLPPDATGLSASLDAVRHGLPLVERLLAAAAAEPPAIPAREQDASQRRWYGPEVPYEGRLPWWEPARRAAAFVRACDYGPFPSPWGRPRLDVGAEVVEVLVAEPSGEPADSLPGGVTGAGTEELRVATADGMLVISRWRRVA